MPVCHDCFVSDARGNRGRALDYSGLTIPSVAKREAEELQALADAQAEADAEPVAPGVNDPT